MRILQLNFNFALHQIEAPVEYQGVGKALSSLRRVNAEEGQSHVTARILGALFSSLTPKTPRLVSIYGLRASEICQSPKINPSQNKQYGFFSARIGADATTIWAGATSGHGAIAVHLLACMLARMWDSSEAISIWTEIVKHRSESILNDFAEGEMVDLRDVAAAKNTLTRQQLAEWDASARAWLCAADRVNILEQKQLMLILDNTHEQINSVRETYESVIRAWQDSLTAFEALLNGVSQKAKNGEILLALSAWHVYPDLMVVEPYPKTISQKDPLLSSCGILTVGLNDMDGEHGGICWSLPLAQLRHYGPPVNRERTLNSTQRLTLDEFSQVFLGACLHGWGDKGTDSLVMIRWLHKISHPMTKSMEPEHKLPNIAVLSKNFPGWLDILFDASRLCLQAFAKGDESFKQMLRLGRRYANRFLGRTPEWPYFGLSAKGKFVSCIQDEDNRIQILRDTTARVECLPKQMFIRVRRELVNGAKPVYEYATAKPIQRDSSKRQVDGSSRPTFIHQRWVPAASAVKSRINDTRYLRKLVKYFPELGRSLISANKSEPTKEVDLPTAYGTFDITSRCQEFVQQSLGKEKSDLQQIIQDSSDRRRQSYEQRGEDVFLFDRSTIEDFQVEKMGVFWPTYGANDGIANPWYNLVYGDESMGIFADSGDQKIQAAMENLSLEQFHSIFESTLWSSTELYNALARGISTMKLSSQYSRSLEAISIAASLYRDLEPATIDIRVLEHHLWQSPWISLYETRKAQASRYTPSPFMPEEVDRVSLQLPKQTVLNRTFSCICFFESGRFQIPPKSMENVMAMCSNDLIWVASYLLDDPSSKSNIDGQYQITVLPGNIGRSGIAFLVPPVDSMVRPKNIHNFRDVVHRPFEGHFQKKIPTTSLHLTSTTAEVPLAVSFSGQKDDELYLLETLLSVYEGNKWVADLDVRRSFDSDKYRRLVGTCTEHAACSIDVKQDISCIDNWEELLDPPKTQFSIIRACGDWQARLATFSIAVSTGHDVIILPNSFHWLCDMDQVLAEEEEGNRKVILIA